MDWIQYLHRHKIKEVDIVFSKCPEKLFSKALELGAGDGFQSALLAKYISKLTCTEIEPEILKNNTNEAIEYCVCDAEEIERVFKKAEFDMVFSSNALEHLLYPQKALNGIHEVLKDDGIAIHIMPNPFWKFCSLFFYLPNRFFIVLKKFTRGNELEALKQGYATQQSGAHKPLLQSALIPSPHGASRSNVGEFYAFSAHRWRREFDKANFDTISIIKGPVASGYGFGFDRIRELLERLGFASEYVYILVKKNHCSTYERFFSKRGRII